MPAKKNSKKKAPAKKKTPAKKKPVAKKPKPAGKITHYFSNIKVAVIKVLMPLKVGDKIRIEGGENTDFEQEIKSMQIDYKEVKLAKKGKSVGIKVSKKVRDNYLVYKIK